MEGGKRWQRLNLSEAIKTVKVPRVVTTSSQESPCSISRQTSSNSLQDSAGLSRSASNSGKFTRLRQAVSPSQGQVRVGQEAQEAEEAQEVTNANVVLLDSGIASIDDTTSARSMGGGGGGGGGCGGGGEGGAGGLKCNGRLQRTSRIEESEPVERSWRVQEQQEPLVTTVPTVPGLLQTNSRCNVQTSGWL